MVIDLGLIDYELAYREQKELVRRRKLGEIGDSLILAEHKAVFTIGRTGKIEHLLEDEGALLEKGIKVLRVDRGGDITFHGPGQLVAYPIIDLRAHKQDLHQYLRDLEEVVINFLNGYAVSGERIEGMTGVWTTGRKIASIGIGALDWVTYHGLSINLDCDLNFFSMIHPCGLKGVEMTSLKKVLGYNISMEESKERFILNYRETFGVKEDGLAIGQGACLA